MNTYAESVIGNPPTPNGYYVLISPTGKMEAASDEALKLLFNGNGKLGMNISDGYSEFKRIFSEGIIEQLDTSLEVILDLVVDNNGYRVYVGNKTHEVFYLIAVVPINDLTIAATWETDRNKILLRYMSNETDIFEYFTIKNTGYYTINYVIDNDFYYFDKPMGNIEPGESIKITMKACVKDECDLPPILISNVNLDYDMCYKTIELAVEKELTDCKYDDYEVRKGPLDGYYHTIYFDKKKNTTCKGGIEYLPSDKIPSSIYINILIYNR